MKNPNIEQLLERYRQGSLNDRELDELNRLAGRDELMSNAYRRADGIVRRRRGTLFAVVGMLVVGAAIGSLFFSLRPSEPTLVAEAVVPEVVVTETPKPQVKQVVPVSHAERQPRATKQPRRTSIHPKASNDPVVVCNNQCEADSVISDIWKFLTV